MVSGLFGKISLVIFGGFTPLCRATLIVDQNHAIFVDDVILSQNIQGRLRHFIFANKLFVNAIVRSRCGYEDVIYACHKKPFV